MNCDICGRQHHAQKLPFLCAVDARNQLYEKRLAYANALLENERSERQIDEFSEQPTGKISLDKWKSEQQRAVDETNDIIAQADRLRADIEAARKEIVDRKAGLARRRADLASVSASSGAATRRARQLEEAERSIAMSKFKWNRSADSMAATRGFLCMEAARLYGLRRVKKGSTVHYEIGGLDIIDLHAMNSEPAVLCHTLCAVLMVSIATPPEVISTCFAHITHILVLACHYLAIRLPAEITLPHREYPRPTIFSLASSYTHGEVSFPGTALLTQPTTASSKGREMQQAPPRPRPLFLDKDLPSLAKEDPQAHKMFLEGVILLAYDIAWACCTQGVSIGDRTSAEDVTNIGRNLYNLLIGNQLLSNPAGRIFPAANAHEGDLGVGELAKLATTLMGRHAHGTAHTFLNDEFTRSFKLPNPKTLTDRLKSKLSNGGPVADWEVLDDDAWVADDPMEDGVLWKGNRREPDQRLFGVESVATVRTTLDDSMIGGSIFSRPGGETSPERVRSLGTGGWTKVRSR